MAHESTAHDPIVNETPERARLLAARRLEGSEPLERATAKVRTSALSRHGIHRLEIVSRSRLRQLLEAAARREGENMKAVPDEAFRSECLARLHRAEGLVGRLRGQIASLERAVGALEHRPAQPFAKATATTPVRRRRLCPVEARRLALIQEMLRPDLEG